MLVPSAASAGTVESQYVQIKISLNVGEDRKSALESVLRSVETCFMDLLERPDVVGLDVEESVFMRFSDHHSRPWLGNPVYSWVKAEALVRTNVRREGKRLIVEPLGGRYPRAEHVETRRMLVFIRAVHLRLACHLKEVMGPLDMDKLGSTPLNTVHINEYLARRHDEWAALKEAALKELGDIEISVPIVFRR